MPAAQLSVTHLPAFFDTTRELFDKRAATHQAVLSEAARAMQPEMSKGWSFFQNFGALLYKYEAQISADVGYASGQVTSEPPLTADGHELGADRSPERTAGQHGQPPPPPHPLLDPAPPLPLPNGFSNVVAPVPSAEDDEFEEAMEVDTEHRGKNANTAADWNSIESYEALMAVATAGNIKGKGKGKREGGGETGEAQAQ